MQDCYCSPQLTTLPPAYGTEKANDDGDGRCVRPQLLEEEMVISEDYVRMLLQTIRVHDGEKLALLQNIEDCLKPEQAEVQRLRREASRREEEMAQLRRDLSESRLMLQEERERASRLLHENTVLLAQAGDERARLKALLQQRRQPRPDAAAPEGKKRPPNFCPPPPPQRPRGAGGTMSLRQAVRCQQPAVAADDELSSGTDEMVQGPPSSALVDALEGEVQMLQAQLDAQREGYENERTKQLHAERECTRQHAEEVGRYIATIDHLHALQRASLADLIRTRHDMQIEQRELRGAVEKLTISLNEALAALDNDRRRHAEDLRQARQRAGDNFDAITRRLRQELGERRALAIAEKEQHTALLTASEAEIERLQDALKKEKKRQRRLEERHRLEFEGLNSEVNLMRQAMRAMEKRVYFSQGRCLPV